MMTPEKILEWVNLISVMTIFCSVLSYESNGARIKRGIQFTAWLILIGTGVTSIQTMHTILYGGMGVPFFRVLGNIGIAIVMVRNRGNLARFFSLSGNGKQRTDP